MKKPYARNVSGKQQFMVVPIYPNGRVKATTDDYNAAETDRELVHLAEMTFVLCAGCFSLILEIGYKRHQDDCLPFLRTVASSNRESPSTRRKGCDRKAQSIKHRAHNWTDTDGVTRGFVFRCSGYTLYTETPEDDSPLPTMPGWHPCTEYAGGPHAEHGWVVNGGARVQCPGIPHVFNHCGRDELHDEHMWIDGKSRVQCTGVPVN